MKKYKYSIRAFSLVEVILALGIAAFALLSVFGLLPIGVSSNQASIAQTTATNIATQMLSDLRQTPTAAAIAANAALKPQSPIYGIDVTKASAILYLDESGAVHSPAATARYKATVSLTQPSGGADSDERQRCH